MDKGSTLIGTEVLDFDMSFKWSKKLLQAINKKYFIPDTIKRINFYRIEDTDTDNVINFIKVSINHDITGIGINVEAIDTCEDFKMEAKPYVQAIVEAAKRETNALVIAQYIDLHYLDVTSSDIESILTTFPNLSDQLSLVGSELIISSPIILPNIKYKLQKLDLTETNISSLNGEEDGARNLIDMINNSQLKDSLQEISRWKSN
mmetsp:Transcript_23129/g.25686  ORF Transcript_23129/g.25686 Transcript_23129/m.25686 type:complete len:205 (+) Transcript_23129:637-1251(+)